MPDWMAFNPADYVANTLHLTTRQHGGYILLICAAWAGRGYLPGTDAGLASIAKLSPREWREDGDTLKALLTRHGDAWMHERVSFEWQDAESLIAAKQKGGREGARRRWEGRAKRNADGTPITQQWDSQWQNDAPLPSPLPSTETTIRTEGTKDGASAPRSPTPPDVAQAVELWNDAADRVGWPKVQAVTDARRKGLKARLAECGGIDGWRAAIAKAEASSFLTGKTVRGNGHENWRCDLDFILRQAKFTKLMEGAFDDRPVSTDRKQSNLGANLQALAEWGREGAGG